MAYTQFKGFKRVFSSNTAYSGATHDDFLYFVRDDANDVEGQIWFQGMCYGSCRDSEIDKINTALAGFLTGATLIDVREYIDEAIAELAGKDSSASGESADKHVKVQVDIADSELTAVTVTTTDIASAAELDAVEAGLGFENGTAYTNSGHYISGDTVAQDIDRLDDAIFAVQADFNTEVDAIETAVGLDADGTLPSDWAEGANYYATGDTVIGAVEKLDSALKNVADRSIDEGQSTENYVALDVTTTDGATVITIDDSALKTAIEAMDYTGVTPNRQAIVNVTEADGVITATQGDIAAEYVTIADADDLFTATNVEDALAELAGKVNANEIENADGSINVTPGTGSTDINVAIKSGEHVLAKDGGNGLYTDIKLSGITPSSTTVKEEYALLGTDGSQLGDTIKIYKDSSLVSMQLVEEIVSGSSKQYLRYTYIDNSGNTQTTDVDVSLLLSENEFKDGLQVNGAGEVSVKKDSTSEDFLSVSSNGVKVSGIQDAIDAAETAATAYTQTQIEALDYSDSAATGQYVSEVDETNGVISVQRANVSEATLNNYAKGSDASAVAATDTVNDAISKLENQVDAAKAAATTKVEKDANANHITLSSATSVSDGSVTYTIGESDIASATALTETASTLYNMVTAETQTRESEDDRLEELISGLTDDLAVEIAARKAVDGQNGQTYSANSGANYISDATSLNDADVKLDTALNGVDNRLGDVEEAYITGVTVNDCAATVTDHVASVEIHADDIKIGTPLTADTGSSVSGFGADAKVDDVLQAIMDELNEATAGSYSGVTSTGHSLSVTNQTNGNNVEFLKERATDTTVENGHLELAQNANNEWYGAMYWIDEETA